MMKILKPLLFLPLFYLAACFMSCKNTHDYEKYVKELDSLKVVVEQAIGNFKTVDSVSAYNASIKAQTYTQFINTSLKDTISKQEAESLQEFSFSGTGLGLYLEKRHQWLSEAYATVNQLHNLSHDLKNGSIETDEAVEYIHNEKQNSEKIIEELKINTELARSVMETHLRTLPLVEELVKKLNNGSLPPLPIKPEKST